MTKAENLNKRRVSLEIHPNMIINFGNQNLEYFGRKFGPVSKLQHSDRVNFATIFIISKIIDGKTNLATVVNNDNKGGLKIRKLPGGCSEMGETIRQTIAFECEEESGFVPTEVTHVISIGVPSKEDKDPNHPKGATHFKIIMWINVKKGSARTKEMLDPENSKFEFVPIKEIMSDFNFNRGHKQFIHEWESFLKWSRTGEIVY